MYAVRLGFMVTFYQNYEKWEENFFISRNTINNWFSIGKFFNNKTDFHIPLVLNLNLLHIHPPPQIRPTVNGCVSIGLAALIITGSGEVISNSEVDGEAIRWEQFLRSCRLGQL